MHGSPETRSQGEIEAAVCDAVARFQQEYMGRGPRHVHAHLVDNRVFVHLEGVLTAAEPAPAPGREAATPAPHPPEPSHDLPSARGVLSCTGGFGGGRGAA